MPNDFSWVHDGVDVWFNVKGPYEGRYFGVVDGEPKNIGFDPSFPHIVVRLRDICKDWEKITGLHFAACVPVTCLEKRTK